MNIFFQQGRGYCRVVLVGVLFFCSAFFSCANAHEYKAGELQIIHPWLRATPQGAKVAGGYFKIINHGKTADRLVSVSSGLSDKTEIHFMTVTHGVMKMRHLPEGVKIAPGGEVEFRPGGLHVMFMKIPAALKQGEKFKGKLVFEKAGAIDVIFNVEALDAAASGKNMGHQH